MNHDKIADARERIAAGTLETPTIIDCVASRILDEFGDIEVLDNMLILTPVDDQESE